MFSDFDWDMRQHTHGQTSNARQLEQYFRFEELNLDCTGPGPCCWVSTNPSPGYGIILSEACPSNP